MMVDRLWPNSTVVCIGSGPSLTSEDVAYVRGKARVIVINTTWQLAPWADVLYAADEPWWRYYQGVPQFHGMKFSIEPSHRPSCHRPEWGVTILRNTGPLGLELKPTGLRTGRNSGYQAIGLAYHLGASRIVLLGYDMRGGHWHPEHPAGVRKSVPVSSFRHAFTTLAGPLKERGVTVVNCSRRTALTAFPQMPLEEALPDGVVRVA